MQMGDYSDKLCCLRCTTRMRPPLITCTFGHLVCNKCKYHQIPDTENSGGSNNCSGQAFELPDVNKLFKNTFDFCQYDCAFQSNLLEIAEHEKVCSKQDRVVYCAIDGCQWVDAVSKLISHVQGNHPDRIKTFCNKAINIELKDPVMLVTQFDINSSVNEIYWLRMLENENNRYIMLLYMGRTVPEGEIERLRMEKFYISAANNDSTSVRTAVVNGTDIYNERITDNNFMINKGTNITILKENSLVVSKEDATTMTIPENILSLLECVVCLEVLNAPIRQCEMGHSCCGRCASKLNACPTCRRGMLNIRNYTIEKLCDSLYTVCKNKETGCNVSRPLGEMMLHDKVCKYQRTTCLVRIGCEWSGTYNNLLKHWQQKHDYLLKPNGSVVLSDGRYWYLYYVAGNYFVYAHTSNYDNESYYLSVHHLTHQDESDFYFDLEFSHPVTGQSFNYSRPCQASTPEQTRSEEYLQSGKTTCKIKFSWFDEIVRDNNSQFCRTLKIYRKSN